MNECTTDSRRRVTPANRLRLDYEAAAADFSPRPDGIIDAHAHIGGADATRIYRRAAERYGITLTYSMTHLEELPAIREVMGDAIRFIAVPNYQAEDKLYHLGRGFLDRIERFHAAGARIIKFWAAPLALDYAVELGNADLFRLDAPLRIEAMELAASLGMVFMTHVGDPDTWFATRYRDASVYGTKRQQYEPLERLLDRFDQPWIAAHMGGWPEDLDFLTGLLDRHRHLHLDTSATKWMVRELSRHSRDELIAFLRRFQGRILFGSDIVTSDDHLVPAEDATEMGGKADSPDEAFDLYASRYWATRALLETDYDGESPIADPDLAMVDPTRDPMDAPRLVGKRLPADVLQSVYHDAARDLLEPVFQIAP